MATPGSATPAASVGARIEMDVQEDARLALQIAVAGPTLGTQERLTVTLDGEPLDAAEVSAPVGGRHHLVTAPPGRLVVEYAAEVAAGTGADTPTASPTEQVVALRPSRYCPSDSVPGLASCLVPAGDGVPADAVMDAVCAHLHERLAYVSGSSGPTTDAVETLLSGQGVCRDFAHAAAMLGRALGVPTRTASVYAPGLDPMDLHAVVEACVDDHWYVWDATRLAPRPSLVRIATGRDAADTAFVTVTRGRADLTTLEVTAVARGDLPTDDHTGRAHLAAP